MSLISQGVPNFTPDFLGRVLWSGAVTRGRMPWSRGRTPSGVVWFVWCGLLCAAIAEVNQDSDKGQGPRNRTAERAHPPLSLCSSSLS